MKPKRSFSVVGLCFFLMVGLSWEVGAFSEEDLEKLKATKACVKCDLSQADLSRSNLIRVDLTEANLFGVNLSGVRMFGANLTGADLSWANLTKADLRNANLIGADLTGADLTGADLNIANLTIADLSGANLTDIKIDDKAIATNKTLTEWNRKKKKEEAKRLAEETRKKEKAKRLAEEKRKKEEVKRLAEKKERLDTLLATKKCVGCDLVRFDLSNADLSGADLSGANLLEADLTRANLSGADLTGSRLTASDLSGASLTGVILDKAFLTDTILTAADLSGVDLTGAKLEGADLTEANLTGADLSGANLRRVDLTGVDLTGANMDGTELDEKTLIRLSLRNDYDSLPQGLKDQIENRRKVIASNPGFRNLKPGLHVDEIKQIQVCGSGGLSTSFATCYDLDNIQFQGEFRSGILEVLRIDLGPRSGGGFVQAVVEMLDDDPILNMRGTLGSKYEMDYDWSERDRQLFNAQEKENLYTVYAKGQVAFRLHKNRTYVEYRDPETAKKFLEDNKPKKATKSDF